MGGEQTYVLHMWTKRALLRGDHLGGTCFRAGLDAGGPAQSFHIKTLNSPPKRPGRLGNSSFTIQ